MNKKVENSKHVIIIVKRIRIGIPREYSGKRLSQYNYEYRLNENNDFLLTNYVTCKIILQLFIYYLSYK